MTIADRQPRIPPLNGFEPVRRAVVLGAGTMGAGIAAHLANCGIEVSLLDRAVDGDDRSALAKAGIARQLASGGFMVPEFAERVTPGTVDDDLAACADADWVIEAVFEDPAVKHALYARVDAVRRPGTLVSSNTSGIPVRELVAGHSAAFAQDFTITHFFNPPRTMELLEVVAGAATGAAAHARVAAACDRQLGKVVLECRDTPGFIANRLGSHWMAVAALEAFRAGLDVETADAVMSRPLGIPRTGVFGLFDLVGINLVPLLWPVLTDALPATDACHDYDIGSEPVFTHLLANGLTGRLGPGGFYRRRNAAGEKVDEVLDIDVLDYRPRLEPSDPAVAAKDLASLLAIDSPGGRYAWTVFAQVLDYACAIAAEVAEDIEPIDDAMRLGYAWARGPFGLADEVGAARLVERYTAAGRAVPLLLTRAAEVGGFYPDPGSVLGTDGTPRYRTRVAGVVTVAEAERKNGVIKANASAALVDLGDGVACLALRTKMNTCDRGVIDMVEEATRLGRSGRFRALVIGSDHPRAFSAGADLGTFVSLLDADDLDGLRSFARRGQRAFEELRRAPFPVVAAARGFALGGGNELMLAAHHIVAHAELKAGFPERTVGLIPCWGGVTQTLARATAAGDRDPAASAFALAASCEVTTSAWQAADWHLLRDTDEVVASARRVLAEAKAAALELLTAGATAPEPVMLPLRDPAAGALDADWAEASETDRRIVGRLAAVLTASRQGETVTEAELLDREIDAALDLLPQPSSQARVRHLRATNRPLAN
ncbi:MAG TPA: 3-hydroxyacyl-CoA dehydrogenase NAD-binding domain-containing protein [Propionicimonas sp.]|jgi:3-hydroxyacyl-CoA dehydrogenase|uniref:3-hydroxyacyl-CoA dehydrogenase/enoyl-CoA hydratase family protein n=1 Tax=Propionicimonas sp. TaxID=1955623 RepID=UPI002F3F3D40